MTTPRRRPSPASRETRRSRRPAPRGATFLERNRNRLLWGGGAVVFVILASMAFLNASTPAFACTAQFDPSPAPRVVTPTAAPVASGASPAPAVTAPAPGFVQADMGHIHVALGSQVTYANCPPASGKHYQSPGGPIRGGLYGPNDAAIPQGWVHNLEHGGIVLLYKCPGDACTDAGQNALKALLAKWPNSPYCGTPPGALTPVFTRFDEMAWPYAAVVWDVVLPMQTLDEATLFEFYARQGERFNPEKLCPEPTPTPGPTPTARPTGTPKPSAAPTGSAAPAASGSPAPATSTAPSPS